MGSNYNTDSGIRINRRTDPVVIKKGEVTSPLYPLEIVIALRDDGELSVILPDYERPYMAYKDTSPRFWTYVSLSAWDTYAARWFYDCPLGADGPGDN